MDCGLTKPARLSYIWTFRRFDMAILRSHNLILFISESGLFKAPIQLQRGKLEGLPALWSGLMVRGINCRMTF
jgi:hypothetical protein